MEEKQKSKVYEGGGGAAADGRCPTSPNQNVTRTVAEGGGEAASQGRVSLYSRPSVTRPSAVVELLPLLVSNRYAARVRELRRCSNPKRRKALKQALPCFTPAGVFNPRQAAGRQSYSGYLCLDFDGKDNPAISDWREAAHTIGRAVPSIVYAGLSCGGNGLFTVHRIATPERYAEHWDALNNELSGLGLMPDQACRDICRLRFVSYDPCPYVNWDAAPHILMQKQPEKRQPYRKDESINRDLISRDFGPISGPYYRTGGRGRAAAVERAVCSLVDRGANIAESYPDWFAIGCSLAAGLGEQGRPLFHVVSGLSAKYDGAECDAKYTECLCHCERFTLGTFFWHCKRAGIRY